MSTLKVSAITHPSASSDAIKIASDGTAGLGALTTNAQTGTTYTFVADDAWKVTTASNAAAVTFTIPPQSSVAWPDGAVIRVINYGAGALTVDGGSGVTVTNTATTIAQYSGAQAIRTGSDAWTLVPFGGGEIPAAEISSPAATGQYTDSGTTYDYYTFTASGTLTVDTAGFADVLVVGGGGAGGAVSGGAGGAGGHLLATSVYLSAATHTVTVGAGGAGVATTTNEGRNGTVGGASSLAGFLYAPGGGGGVGRSYNSVGIYYSQAGIGGASGGGSGGYSTGSAASGGSGISGLGSDGGQADGTGNGGGGGGAGAVGGNASSGSATGGAGGAGSSSSIDGSATTRAGGGGGRGSTTGGSGGSGGGGAGSSGNGNGTSGTANSGGGGGGGGNTAGNTGGSGGSGVVIVRVKV